ncbi:lytic transglycosylase domain-containing protein [Rhizobium tubonense]|uniref:Glycosyl transferase n=1 Tax=Rhizobium tubonense TaxID=484088 RepID=A0A2W4D174_9HYPH|nr:lytic transglycosylase domain-containing protein [Rhizobium tubonense]PZM17181.1 glycosyl transferase [Rhizobium tubonense]
MNVIRRNSGIWPRISAWLPAAAFALSFAASAPPAFSEPSAAAPACLYSGASEFAPGETLCIKANDFNHDLCVAIEHFASANRLPPDYLARLIWRESRFRADAISPKGARGIAQFMPGTAELRGLENSLDVLEALRASARYLDDLRTRFGNLGLAAAAYNAGEQRLSDFLTSGSLPFETRSYVLGITGHTVEEWETPAGELALPLLDRGKPFLDACVTLANSRRLVAPVEQANGVWAPWGVQLAAGPRNDVARSLFANAVRRLPAPLNEEQPLIIRQRDRDFGFRPRYSARIGRQTRAEATETCSAIRKAGGTCLVFKSL